ncbi:MAG TPA: hypothetical protein VFR97_10675 [Capillimicrobium sp.]|nr:hypothetical protein [Capillimicrobium sp.]
MTDLSCEGWQAICDHMPGAPRELRVTGSCRAPVGGLTVGLRRKEPQGINPRDLLLELVVDRPEVGPEVETNYAVEYVERDPAEYDTVSIAGVAAGIEVQHVE